MDVRALRHSSFKQPVTLNLRSSRAAAPLQCAAPAHGAGRASPSSPHGSICLVPWCPAPNAPARLGDSSGERLGYWAAPRCRGAGCHGHHAPCTGLLAAGGRPRPIPLWPSDWDPRPWGGCHHSEQPPAGTEPPSPDSQPPAGFRRMLSIPPSAGARCHHPHSLLAPLYPFPQSPPCPPAPIPQPLLSPSTPILHPSLTPLSITPTPSCSLCPIPKPFPCPLCTSHSGGFLLLQAAWDRLGSTRRARGTVSSRPVPTPSATAGPAGRRSHFRKIPLCRCGPGLEQAQSLCGEGAHRPVGT